MNEKLNSPIVAIVDDFNSAKNELKEALSQNESQNQNFENQTTSNSEQRLETSFENLLKFNPKNLDEMSVKFETLFAEIIAESELAEYHKKALRAALSDLNAFSHMNNK